MDDMLAKELSFLWCSWSQSPSPLSKSTPKLPRKSLNWTPQLMRGKIVANHLPTPTWMIFHGISVYYYHCSPRLCSRRNAPRWAKRECRSPPGMENPPWKNDPMFWWQAAVMGLSSRLSHVPTPARWRARVWTASQWSLRGTDRTPGGGKVLWISLGACNI